MNEEIKTLKDYFERTSAKKLKVLDPSSQEAWLPLSLLDCSY